MTNPVFTIFEEDQVLTAQHLNELRTYLDHQDRLTRTHLIGIGILCGLEVKNPDHQTIRITKGVGITSGGHLIHLPEKNCTHIRSYSDPKTMVPESDDQQAGIYQHFRIDNNGQQIQLWELLTEEEEKDIDDTDTHRIDLDNGITITEEGTDIVVDFTQFCVLLYLELEDEDLE
ncbi:MAG: hypothetical protein R3211_08740, partial [Balneolaceae bacterium]|nr:hypothetical protein [Balneolaceae bacterium]